MKIRICHLYASELNIYGDTGNALVLKKRLEWRGYEVEIVRVGVSEELPSDPDILLAGGGQDAAQGLVEEDLLKRKGELQDLVESGLPMLLICGSYQLFGEKFVTSSGKEIKGLGILPIYTIAEEGRLIGNVSARRNSYDVQGYENHSGRTYFTDQALPLASVGLGMGK